MRKEQTPFELEPALINYQSIILFLLMEDRGRTKDIEELDEEDFLDGMLCTNFINMRELTRRGLVCDLSTYLATYCTEPHNIDFLSPALHHYPAMENYDFYLTTLRKLTMDERLFLIHEEFINCADRVEGRFIMNSEIEKLESKSKEKSVDMSHALQKMHEEFDLRLENKQDNVVSCGLSVLDYFFSTINGPYLFVLGARPGIGKSAFALQMASESAKRGKRVGFVSLELSLETIAMRLTSHEKKINLTDLYSFDQNTINSYYKDPMHAEYDIFFDKPDDRSINNIIKRIYLLVKRDKVDFVILDHLRNISDNLSSADEHRVIRNYMEKLYHAAHSLKVPLIILTQLNRECEKPNVIPKLNWLQGSSAIEQYADAVIFQYVTGEDPVTPAYDVIFRIMKSRGSSKLKLPSVRFDGTVQTFTEVDNVFAFQPNMSVKDYANGKDAY